MRSRIVASGVVALALASVAVPAALSGSASAKPSSSTAAPTVTGCSPKAGATIGKSVTIHGTGLTKATSVSIGTTKKNTVVIDAPFTKNTKTLIKLKTPTGAKGVKAGSDNVTVTTANGTSTAASCTFKAAPKKGKK